MAEDLSQIMGYESPLGQNSLFEDSPFGPDWDKPKAELAGTIPQTENTIYYKFIPYTDMETMYEDFINAQYLINKHTGADILITYSSGTNDELLILIRRNPNLYSNLVSSSVYSYSDLSMNVTFKERLIKKMMVSKPDDFRFTETEVTAALLQAIEDYKFSIDFKDLTGPSSNYTLSAGELNGMVNKNEKGVKALLLQINKTIAKMTEEEKNTYNQWIRPIANPNNYFFPVQYRKESLSADDLRRFLNQLNNINTAIKDIRGGNIDSVEKLMEIVDTRLTTGGDEMKWFINTPFFKLSKAQRKKYLSLFAEEDSSLLGQLSISSEIGKGEVVLQLFATCTDKAELISIILELEQEGRLFDLLDKLKLSVFKDVSLLISGAYLEYLKDKAPDIYVKSVEKGYSLTFDNTTFGNHNVENFDVKKRKLVFNTQNNEILKGLSLSLTTLFGDELQNPVECDPLDIISFSPARNITLSGLDLTGGENYKLPACLIYVIYRQESIDSVILGGMIILQAAACLVGVGEVLAAIEAASAFGIVWSGTGLVIDTAFLSSLPPEVREDHPTFVKYVNYAVWARIISETAGLRSMESEINSGLSRTKVAATKALNKISSATRKALQDIGMEIKSVKDYFVVRLGRNPVFKGNETEIEYFWNKILKNSIATGTGGSLKYLRILSRNVVEQEHSMSCAAACIRQYARDHGIEVSETIVRDYARTTIESGTFPDGIYDGLKSIFKDQEVIAGAYYNPLISDIDMARSVSKDGSWICNIRPFNGKNHTIIVDKIETNKVFIRDPWPIEGIGKGTGGVEAIINEKEFAVLWAQGGNLGFKIKK